MGLPTVPRKGLRLLGLSTELAILCVGLVLFHVEEDQGLLAILPIVGVGFVVHALLPLRLRLPCFLAVSLAALYAVSGWAVGSTVVAIGLILIGACHLPIAFRLRIAVVACLAGALVLARLDLPGIGAAPAVLPVVASFFMFRLLVYLYDLRHEKVPASAWTRLSYFFLLPNVCFLIFPVVDYATFRRCHYAREDVAIYQKGIAWMLRGFSHLVGYRVVAYYFAVPVSQVHDLPSLIVHLITRYSELLRISGQFHLAIGILCLFGFDLPRPQIFYYLASSFADYWRRANVYWRNFMVKLILYPTFQRLRRLRARQPLVVATLIVFLCSWLLHAWQWFWLVGSARLGGTDAAFWAVFGMAVATNAWQEGRRRKPRRTLPLDSWRSCWRHASLVLLTYSATCLLWALWTSDSIASWWSTLAAARSVTPSQLAALAATILALLAVGAAVTRALRRRAANPGVAASADRPHRLAPALTACAACAVALLGASPVQVRLPPAVAKVLFSLGEARLGADELAEQRAGYYEEMQNNPRITSRHWFYRAKKWRDREEGPFEQQTGPVHLVIRPNVSTIYQGQRFHSNRWGMRDRDYELQKAPGTYRVAVIGPSDTLGWGVADERVFENVTEDLLARDPPRGPGAPERWEMLNFSLPHLQPLEQVEVLRRRVVPFAPDAVLWVVHPGDDGEAANNLAGWLSEGVPLDPELQALVEAVGPDPEDDPSTLSRRLRPQGEAALAWSLREAAAIADEHGMLPIAVLLPSLAATPDHSAATRLIELAAAAPMQSIDLSAMFDAEPHERLYLTPWDTHPGPEAHARIALELKQQLVRLRPWETAHDVASAHR